MATKKEMETAMYWAIKDCIELGMVYPTLRVELKGVMNQLGKAMSPCLWNQALKSGRKDPVFTNGGA